MIKWTGYFLFIVIALNQYGFIDCSQSVCVLEDAPSQCGSFCLSALRPFIDHNHKIRQQWNSHGIKLNQTLEKLYRIEVNCGSLAETLHTLENKLLAMQSDVENKLRTVQSTMETKWKAIQDSVESQQMYLQATLSKILLKKDFSRFELMGTRLFYIENDKPMNYNEAENACREMGGHLAIFQHEQELTVIKGKLNKIKRLYWLGINDLAKNGEYVSSASGKKPTYFNWQNDQPDNKNNDEHCVGLQDNLMHDYPCSALAYSICQADEI